MTDRSKVQPAHPTKTQRTMLKRPIEESKIKEVNRITISNSCV
jgi:hypothetical protein